LVGSLVCWLVCCLLGLLFGHVTTFHEQNCSNCVLTVRIH
jgi:hypothetical protein